MIAGTIKDADKSAGVESHREEAQKGEGDFSLETMFQKMQKLGIPADLFGNINPGWRLVMKRLYQSERELDAKMDQESRKAIAKISKYCETKYGLDNQKAQDCQQQAQLRITNHFQKPKELSQLLLSNFANRCLIRGNTVDFCLGQAIREKKVINSQSLKKLQGIQEYL